MDKNKDFKLCSFLQVLESQQELSVKALAKMGDVTEKDIENMLLEQPPSVTIQVKYKIADTVMSLKFFLKDCEPSTNI